MWLLALLALSSPAVANPYAPSPPAALDQADPFEWTAAAVRVAPGGEALVQLRLVVPPGMVVYRDQLEITVVDAGGLSIGAPDLPPGLVKPDPVDGADLREQYDMDVVVNLPVRAGPEPGLVRLVLSLRHQGCHGRLCHPPRTVEQGVWVHVAADDAPTAPE